MEVRLSRLIAPAFFSVHQDIKEGRYVHYWLKGGRGSTKSSFVSLEIVLGLMREDGTHAVVLRKVYRTVQGSVFEQIAWAIEALGVETVWQKKLSPLEWVYRPTGQRIVFRGADDAGKIKSIKFRRGYCKYLWYEEMDEFGGMEDVRKINQSILRGGEGYCVFYTYNPPKSAGNWVNEEVLTVRKDRLVHHSTYLDVPKAWLGAQFLWEAEQLKESRIEAYRHEYLGEITGTGGQVFCNVKLREITDEEITQFDHIGRGLDWGFASDPLHYTVNHYDATRRRLYIFFELHQVGLSNRQAAAKIKAENRQNGLVVCDSAEPKSIAELAGYGVRVMGAKKGPDSVEYGIKFLQDLDEIVIDPVRCPHTAKEFMGYELDEDKNGGFIARFPDRDNHSIDAVRYSLLLSPKKKQPPKAPDPFGMEKSKRAAQGKRQVI